METFPCYWPLARGIHRSPVDSPNKEPVKRGFGVSFMSARTNCWASSRMAAIWNAMMVMWCDLSHADSVIRSLKYNGNKLLQNVNFEMSLQFDMRLSSNAADSPAILAKVCFICVTDYAYIIKWTGIHLYLIIYTHEMYMYTHKTMMYTRSFDLFFDLRLNKWLSKQSRHRWFETPPGSLCRHRNAESHLASIKHVEQYTTQHEA